MDKEERSNKWNGINIFELGLRSGFIIVWVCGRFELVGVGPSIGSDLWVCGQVRARGCRPMGGVWVFDGTWAYSQA